MVSGGQLSYALAQYLRSFIGRQLRARAAGRLYAVTALIPQARGLLFPFDLLRRAAAGDVPCLDVMRHNRLRADHRVLTDGHPRHNQGTESYAGRRPQFRLSMLDHAGLDRIVRVREDSRMFGDGRPPANDQLAPIVE